MAEGLVDEIPAGPFQGRGLAIGGSDSGVINTPGDRDGFAVELVAGQSYVFTLTGTGDNPLIDPFLEIYGQTTEVLAIDDDGGPGRNSLLRYTAETTGTYYINALAWDAFDPADGPPTITGDYTITADLGPPQIHSTRSILASRCRARVSPFTSRPVARPSTERQHRGAGRRARSPPR